MLEITVVRNPVRPALSQHFDPALIDPVENAQLVRYAGVVCGAQPTELEVREEGREIVPTRRSLIHQQLVVVFNRARLGAEPSGPDAEPGDERTLKCPTVEVTWSP